MAIEPPLRFHNQVLSLPNRRTLPWNGSRRQHHQKESQNIYILVGFWCISKTLWFQAEKSMLCIPSPTRGHITVTPSSTALTQSLLAQSAAITRSAHIQHIGDTHTLSIIQQRCWRGISSTNFGMHFSDPGKTLHPHETPRHPGTNQACCANSKTGYGPDSAFIPQLCRSHQWVYFPRAWVRQDGL
jgi:hypothetical protein